MIEDVYVIDGVAHGVDLSPGNWNDPVVCEPFAEHGYRGLHAKYTPRGEPQWTMNEQRYLRGDSADPEVVSHAFFAESWTDAVIYHGVPMFGTFKEGLSPLRVGLEMRERYPGRVEIYGPVSPWMPDPLGEVDRLVEEVGVVGLKIYPTDVYDRKIRSLRMDDPELVFPILERAQQRGIKVVAVHKAIPLGPMPTEPFRTEDMDEAFITFPDLYLEIVHGGAAFLEETAMQLHRFSNALVNLEATSAFLNRSPKRFMEILGAFMAAGAEDRIIWGTGCTAVHPQPLLQRFWDLEFPSEMVEGYDVPQLSREVKSKILGENIAQILDLDIPAMKERARGDAFDKQDELSPPWSGEPVAA
jgi:predicted TIM-barrel fold metal-dependent hydrolase